MCREKRLCAKGLQKANRILPENGRVREATRRWLSRGTVCKKVQVAKRSWEQAAMRKESNREAVGCGETAEANAGRDCEEAKAERKSKWRLSGEIGCWRWLMLREQR